MIEVRQTGHGDPMQFEVTVRDTQGESRHRVTMTRKSFESLSGKTHTPRAVMEAAFRFLLDREPKDSILARFDIGAVAHYFPEFERELSGYLRRGMS